MPVDLLISPLLSANAYGKTTLATASTETGDAFGQILRGAQTVASIPGAASGSVPGVTGDGSPLQRLAVSDVPLRAAMTVANAATATAQSVGMAAVDSGGLEVLGSSDQVGQDIASDAAAPPLNTVTSTLVSSGVPAGIAADMQAGLSTAGGVEPAPLGHAEAAVPAAIAPDTKWAPDAGPAFGVQPGPFKSVKVTFARSGGSAREAASPPSDMTAPLPGISIVAGAVSQNTPVLSAAQTSTGPMAVGRDDQNGTMEGIAPGPGSFQEVPSRVGGTVQALAVPADRFIPGGFMPAARFAQVGTMQRAGIVQHGSLDVATPVQAEALGNAGSVQYSAMQVAVAVRDGPTNVAAGVQDGVTQRAGIIQNGFLDVAAPVQVEALGDAGSVRAMPVAVAVQDGPTNIAAAVQDGVLQRARTVQNEFLDVAAPVQVEALGGAGSVQYNPMPVTVDVRDRPTNVAAAVQDGAMQRAGTVQNGSLDVAAPVQVEALGGAEAVQYNPMPVAVDVRDGPTNVAAAVQDGAMQRAGIVQTSSLDVAAPVHAEALDGAGAVLHGFTPIAVAVQDGAMQRAGIVQNGSLDVVAPVQAEAESGAGAIQRGLTPVAVAAQDRLATVQDGAVQPAKTVQDDVSEVAAPVQVQAMSGTGSARYGAPPSAVTAQDVPMSVVPSAQDGARLPAGTVQGGSADVAVPVHVAALRGAGSVQDGASPVVVSAQDGPAEGGVSVRDGAMERSQAAQDGSGGVEQPVHDRSPQVSASAGNAPVGITVAGQDGPVLARALVQAESASVATPDSGASPLAGRTVQGAIAKPEAVAAEGALQDAPGAEAVPVRQAPAAATMPEGHASVLTHDMMQNAPVLAAVPPTLPVSASGDASEAGIVAQISTDWGTQPATSGSARATGSEVSAPRSSPRPVMPSDTTSLSRDMQWLPAIEKVAPGSSLAAPRFDTAAVMQAARVDGADAAHQQSISPAPPAVPAQVPSVDIPASSNPVADRRGGVRTATPAADPAIPTSASGTVPEQSLPIPSPAASPVLAPAADAPELRATRPPEPAEQVAPVLLTLAKSSDGVQEMTIKMQPCRARHGAGQDHARGVRCDTDRHHG